MPFPKSTVLIATLKSIEDEELRVMLSELLLKSSARKDRRFSIAEPSDSPLGIALEDLAHTGAILCVAKNAAGKRTFEIAEDVASVLNVSTLSDENYLSVAVPA